MIKLTDSGAGRDGNTERRILAAARRIFIRRGTAGARMQEIAEEAGVNQALLHYYFRSKERLAAAVFREVATRLLPSVAQLLGSGAPLAEKVERTVHLYIDTVRSSPFVPAYVVSELHHHPERLQAMVVEATAGRARNPVEVLEGLRAQLQAEADAGRIRRIEPDEFVMNIVALAAAPFLVLPALQVLLQYDEPAFHRLLDRRRAELPEQILHSLRP